MLEWGSGGSTLEFSPQVKKYYSIEHQVMWYKRVQGLIKEKGLKNIHYVHTPQNAPRQKDGRQSEYFQFRDYIDAVDEFHSKFDIVLIDGRARRLCAKKIIPHLSPEAIVIIHDWVLRPPYHCVMDYYELVEKIDYTEQTIAYITL